MTAVGSDTRARPRTLGYRMPPEWARHRGTWISWPHNRETWPGRLEAAERAMTAAVTALARGERVHINVLDPAHGERVREKLAGAGADLGSVRLHHIATNDAWCRDHGAVFVVRDSPRAPLAAIDFGFNAWGGKYPPWDLDDAVPPQMARALGVPCFAADFVLEGGSIDVNGSGALLTTEQCLLNPNRNPQLTRDAIEQRLRDMLGVDQILWLGEGIAGDDTDGHVDDITRFVAPRTVVTAVAQRGDSNHDALAANLQRLRAMRLADGSALEILELPQPRVDDSDGAPLPASYANFYVANDVVLLPAYDHADDEVARSCLSECFANREVVPIDCRDLVHGLGAFHCLTQQIPDTEDR